MSEYREYEGPDRRRHDRSQDHHDPATEAQVARLANEMANLRSEVRAQTDSTKGLVDAWRAAGLVVTFVKYMAALGAAIAALKLAWQNLRT